MRATLTLVAWILVGCSTPSDRDASVDRADVTLSASPADFCDRVMHSLDEAACGYRGRCCTPFERDLLPPEPVAWPVRWDCAEPISDRIAACTAALAGNTRFDAARAGECAAAIGVQPTLALCNGPDPYYGLATPREASPSCALVAGDLPEGADCAAALECASGVCAGGLCGPARAAIGAPCARDLDCPRDAYCAAGTLDGGMAICRYRDQNGESCAMDGIGATGVPTCRSEYCLGHTCIPFCIGASRHSM